MKLPKNLIHKAMRRIHNRVDSLVRKVVASHPSMVLPYYFLMNRSFAGEMRSVFFGAVHHKPGDHGNGSSNTYAFRRNIHRLEKGLIMRPRRPVFATQYIESTTAHFDELTQENRDLSQGMETLVDWSRDVLTTYFETIEKGRDATVDAARLCFESACARMSPKQANSKIPFNAEAREFAKVTIDDFEQLAKKRKSIRWFEDRSVPREVIDRALEAARFSPSACNRQPFEVRVYDNPDMISTLASLPGGTAGFYENIPCLLVFVGRLRAFPKERDRHLIYIDASLAAMSLVFGLESQQVGTCIINWPDIPEKETAVAERMGLEQDERVVLMMAAGYPDPKGPVCWSERKPLEEIRSYNRLAPDRSIG